MFANRFRLHACFDQTPLEQVAGYPASYIHHFFPDANKLTWSDDFWVHIYFIPTTFDTYVEISGCLTNIAVTTPGAVKGPNFHQEHQAQIKASLENAQAFPGGFVSTKRDFQRLLDSGPEQATEEPPAKRLRLALERPNPSARVRIPGRVCGRIEHVFDDGLGPNLFWMVECAMIQNDSSFEDSGPDSLRTACFVHRRIEWFMHFYIDAMSGIQLDSRWRVFLPIRYLGTDPIEAVRLETEAFHNANDTSTNKDSIETLANKVIQEWPTLRNTTVEAFCTTLTGDSHEQVFESNAAMDALLLEALAPFEILGVVTVYQFFALPKDRARISQVFVFPHRQRGGVGRQALSCVIELLCSSNNVRQISVEDPAPVFQRVMDVTALDLALQKGLFRKECLYPDEEVRSAKLRVVAWAESPANPAEWPKYSQVLKHLQKETPTQRRRIRLILSLARLVPSNLLSQSVDSGPADASTTDGGTATPSKRKATTTTAASLNDWQRQNADVSAVRVIEKKRFRLESLEWYSNQRSLSDIQAELESEWQILYRSLCGSIKAIRRIHPLSSSIPAGLAQA